MHSKDMPGLKHLLGFHQAMKLCQWKHGSLLIRKAYQAIAITNTLDILTLILMHIVICDSFIHVHLASK